MRTWTVSRETWTVSREGVFRSLPPGWEGRDGAAAQARLAVSGVQYPSPTFVCVG